MSHQDTAYSLKYFPRSKLTYCDQKERIDAVDQTNQIVTTTECRNTAASCKTGWSQCCFSPAYPLLALSNGSTSKTAHRPQGLWLSRRTSHRTDPNQTPGQAMVGVVQTDSKLLEPGVPQPKSQVVGLFIFVRKNCSQAINHCQLDGFG